MSNTWWRRLGGVLSALLLIGCSAPVLRTYPTLDPTPSASASVPAASPPTPGRTTPSASSSPRVGASTPSAPPLSGVALAPLVIADPRVPDVLREAVRTCGHADCVEVSGYADVTGDGLPDVLLRAYGPSGVEGELIYTPRDGAPVLLLAHYGVGGQLEVRGGEVVLTQKLYLPRDAACCPSGGARASVYRFAGGKMVLVSRAGGTPGASPYDPNDTVVT